MTPYAEKLFYVNKPQIIGGQTFTQSCPLAVEKTVILGCYQSGDRGIYLYKVTDERLKGVEEVTAAHEMLHAAYQRLSSKERNRVDTLLQNFYFQELKDQRVKDTVAAYEKSEPTELPNEMHSIFATEVASLPAELETYYQKYFRNRSAVVAYTAQYQQAFTSRKDQVAAYDVELKNLKQTIDSNQADLLSRRGTLQSLQNQMERLKSSGKIAAYNSQIDTYNADVSGYNELLDNTKQRIKNYNIIVEKRNAIALEERQLSQAMSATALPDAP